MKTLMTIAVMCFFSLRITICQNQKIVPDQFSTIQEAVDASQNGDTVLVKPGVYYGAVDFKGKEILVTSLFGLTNDTSYITNTIITKHPTISSFVMNRAAWFKNGETNKSELSGFSIKDFDINCCGEGAIEIIDASPTLSHLRIQKVRGTGAIAISALATALPSQSIRLNAVQIDNCEVPVSSQNANLEIVNCSITNSGRGLLLIDSQNSSVINSLVDGNWILGGINFTGEKLIVLNSISRTSTPYHGNIPAAISVVADSLVIRNSLINSTSINVSDFVDTVGFAIYTDPMYYMNEYNYSPLEYRPSRYSPGIDKGLESIIVNQKGFISPIRDIDGVVREWMPGNIVDIGPYEYFNDDNTTYEQPSIGLNPSKQYVCSGEDFSITASPAKYSNYYWSYNGSAYAETTMPTILVSNPGTYKVIVYDELGASANHEIAVSPAYPFPNSELCSVSVDSALSVNKLTWRPTSGIGIKSYVIYRETNMSNQFVALDTIPFSEAGVYIDYEVNPRVGSFRYKIKVITDCDELKGSDEIRKSVHLIGFEGFNKEFSLTWEPDETVGVTNYKILRGPSKSKMSVISEIAGSSKSFTDLTPPTGTKFYVIQARIQTGCADLTSVQDTNFEGTVFSNFVEREVVVNLEDNLTPKFSIYPNPATTNFYITASEEISDISIKDMTGRELLRVALENSSKSIEIERGNFTNGIYLIEVVCASKIHIQKISIR